MYLLELLKKSLTGRLSEQESPQLIKMLENEIEFVKDMFKNDMYVVTIESTKGHETGNTSKTVDIVCQKKNGIYQDIRTNEIYGSSVIFAKKIS